MWQNNCISSLLTTQFCINWENITPLELLQNYGEFYNCTFRFIWHIYMTSHSPHLAYAFLITRFPILLVKWWCVHSNAFQTRVQRRHFHKPTLNGWAAPSEKNASNPEPNKQNTHLSQEKVVICILSVPRQIPITHSNVLHHTKLSEDTPWKLWSTLKQIIIAETIFIICAQVTERFWGRYLYLLKTCWKIRWCFKNVWFGLIFALCSSLIRKSGPGWLNELGSWIT